MSEPTPEIPDSTKSNIQTESGSVKAKLFRRIGSQRDLADKSLSPELPKAVRLAASKGPAPASSEIVNQPPRDETSAMEGSETKAPAGAAGATASPTVASLDESAAESGEMEMTLEEEIEAALGGMSVEQLMNLPSDQTTAELASDTRLKATVTRIHGDDVFLKLSGRFEGVTSLRQFAQPPVVGGTLEVIVKRFDEDEGLYAVSVPGASIDVADWSDLTPGAIIEVRITGVNTGGLECNVNNIRGFIPASQVALYRVEQFTDFLNQKLQCVVTDADPERKRLVLSRRAVLEREQAAKREALLKSLEAGQTLSGTVTKLMDFGAFVDIGGLEGLVHISKLSWDRVTHPSEILKVGEKIKVKVEKIAEGSGKLSLSYRDTLQDPWENIEQTFPVNSTARGTVTRIAQFGAFVKLAPGIEGLVHISELAHHRVFAVKNVVNEGDEVEVKILSIDRPAQRISLSLKATQAKPEPKPSGEKAEVEAETPPRTPAVPSRSQPLKGGRDRKTGGESVGLNW